jgi:hypothetical protein
MPESIAKAGAWPCLRVYKLNLDARVRAS